MKTVPLTLSKGKFDCVLTIKFYAHVLYHMVPWQLCFHKQEFYNYYKFILLVGQYFIFFQTYFF